MAMIDFEEPMTVVLNNLKEYTFPDVLSFEVYHRNGTQYVRLIFKDGEKTMDQNTCNNIKIKKNIKDEVKFEDMEEKVRKEIEDKINSSLKVDSKGFSISGFVKVFSEWDETGSLLGYVAVLRRHIIDLNDYPTLINDFGLPIFFEPNNALQYNFNTKGELI